MKRAVLISILALAATPALARPAKRTARADRAPRTAASTSTKTTANTGSADASSGANASTTADAPASAPGPAPAPASNAGNSKMKTKTYTFGAMDVEGKLKTPQLLYFLNRVKLELDMSAPDKRSFMKELEKSADDKSL
jgi:hypothetical protein